MWSHLWADVKLWRADATGCLKLIEELEAFYKPRMLVASDWFTQFSMGNSPEAIFEYQYAETGISSPLYNLYKEGDDNILTANKLAYESAINQYYPTFSELYDYGDTVRTKLSTILGLVGDEKAEIYKYIGSDDTKIAYKSSVERRITNFIFYRFREILLMKIEALGILNTPASYQEAFETYNTIRSKSGLELFADASEIGEGVDFFNRLIVERVAELAYEGKHWFTLLRIARNTKFTELMVNRIAENTLLNVNQQTIRARLLDPEGWFLPYPKSEVEKNPFLKQKYYYEGK